MKPLSGLFGRTPTDHNQFTIAIIFTYLISFSFICRRQSKDYDKLILDITKQNLKQTQFFSQIEIKSEFYHNFLLKKEIK